MTTPLATDARSTLATNLAAVGVKVYDVAPNVPTAPSLVIKPGAPWIVPNRLGGGLSYQLRMDVLIVADGRTNDTALAKCEELIDAVLANTGSGFQIEQVGPPQLTDLGGKGSVLTVETTITCQVKE